YPDGEVLNVGFSSMNHQIKDLTDKIKEVVERETGQDVDIEYKREKDTGPSYNVSFKKLRNYIKTEPRFNIEEGIKELINFFKEE
ncbi:MAG: SDR family NAD-dependent epimerase/dehydratase, partial [Candidatus Nanohaloarchaea archaeon]|nr:SDR family NAD-dependent epimerase/dehydratase [Candidatus Nanohaloarchaea archaeon]